MSESGLAVLDGLAGLQIQQKKEWGEILTGWETKNRYDVRDPDGQLLFHAGETKTGMLSRQFLGSMRPFTIEVRDPQGELVLSVDRPFRWIFPRAEITDGSGQKLGAIQKRWTWFRKRYTIEDAGGAELAELFGPILKPWTFFIHVRGIEQGKIAKKWSGLMKEAFTKADNFGVEFGPLTPQLKALALGATFLIDFVHFEKKNN